MILLCNLGNELNLVIHQTLFNQLPERSLNFKNITEDEHIQLPTYTFEECIRSSVTDLPALARKQYSTIKGKKKPQNLQAQRRFTTFDLAYSGVDSCPLTLLSNLLTFRRTVESGNLCTIRLEW